MMVMAIILLIFIPLTSGIFTRFSERDQASQLGAHLIFCRNAAIKSNRTVFMRIDLGEKKYRAWTLEREGSTIKERALVKETFINVAALSAAYGERLRDGAVVVNFLPSGVAEELAVYFGEGDNISQTLLFSRYTGEMKVVQGEAPLSMEKADWKEDLEDQ
jgi:Tfp pilus assembly protein FimT